VICARKRPGRGGKPSPGTLPLPAGVNQVVEIIEVWVGLWGLGGEATIWDYDVEKLT